MKKLTEDLKKRAKTDKKSQVYCFVIEANRIGFEHQYRNFGNFDTGVKTIESFINNKIDSIFDEKTGSYWSEKFRGFEEIYSLAKLAKQSVIDNTYDESIINLIKGAIKSYVPAIDESRLKGQYSVIPVKVTKEENETFLEQGITGQKLVKMREEEKEYQQKLIDEANERSQMMGLVDSLDDDDEEEEEIEEIEFSEEQKSNILNQADEL